MIRTLVFLEADGSTPWLRFAADGAMTRGGGLATLPRLDPALASEILAVLPGDTVALHWTQLPALAPAQAAAAARMLAADVSATPIELTHVALGAVESDGWRALALVDTAAMTHWLARLADAGIDPDRMVPAPLLLPLPAAGGISVLDFGGLWQVRGDRMAFAAEPELAKLLIGGETLHLLDTTAWEAALPALLSGPMLDLRQGAFSRTRLWSFDPRQLRRLPLLGLALLAAMLATDVAGTLRHGFAADRAELQLADAARSVLPRGTVITDPRAQVAARLASLGGDGAGFSALAAPLLAAMRDRPATELKALSFSPETGLVAALAAPAADREALVASLSAAGLDATLGNERDEAGRSLVDLTVRTR